jgi:hypothetical protein
LRLPPLALLLTAVVVFALELLLLLLLLLLEAPPMTPCGITDLRFEPWGATEAA